MRKIIFVAFATFLLLTGCNDAKKEEIRSSTVEIIDSVDYDMVTDKITLIGKSGNTLCLDKEGKRYTKKLIKYSFTIGNNIYIIKNKDYVYVKNRAGVIEQFKYYTKGV